MKAKEIKPLASLFQVHDAGLGILGLKPQPSQQPSGRDKTAICFSLRDRVGALRDVVQVFAEANLNLSSIHSRPSKRRAWDYLFFVEVDGHAADPHVAAVLREAERQCVFLKVLGAWPLAPSAP